MYHAILAKNSNIFMAVAGSSPVKHKSIEFKLDLKEKKNENIMFSYLLKKKWPYTEFPLKLHSSSQFCMASNADGALLSETFPSSRLHILGSVHGA